MQEQKMSLKRSSSLEKFFSYSEFENNSQISVKSVQGSYTELNPVWFFHWCVAQCAQYKLGPDTESLHKIREISWKFKTCRIIICYPLKQSVHLRLV